MANTILILEDNVDTRDLYKLALETEGHKVELAGGGGEALTYLQNNPAPELILLDLSMPGMGGAEFVDRLKGNADWKNIKVVVISGWDNLQNKAAELGAVGYLKKPFDLSKLYSEVEKHSH